MARHAGRLRVQRKAPATDDKATAALLCRLAREFQVPRQASHITHGVHRQHKTVSLPRPATLPPWFSQRWQRLRVPSPVFRLGSPRAAVFRRFHVKRISP